MDDRPTTPDTYAAIFVFTEMSLDTGIRHGSRGNLPSHRLSQVGLLHAHEQHIQTVELGVHLPACLSVTRLSRLKPKQNTENHDGPMSECIVAVVCGHEHVKNMFFHKYCDATDTYTTQCAICGFRLLIGITVRCVGAARFGRLRQYSLEETKQLVYRLLVGYKNIER